MLSKSSNGKGEKKPSLLLEGSSIDKIISKQGNLICLLLSLSFIYEFEYVFCITYKPKTFLLKMSWIDINFWIPLPRDFKIIFGSFFIMRR